MKWLDSITDWVDMNNLNKHIEMAKDRGAWFAAVHMVAKSQAWISNLKTTNGRFREEYIDNKNYWAIDKIMGQNYEVILVSWSKKWAELRLELRPGQLEQRVRQNLDFTHSISNCLLRGTNVMLVVL